MQTSLLLATEGWEGRKGIGSRRLEGGRKLNFRGKREVRKEGSWKWRD